MTLVLPSSPPRRPRALPRAATIAPATAADVPAIAGLLREAGLPADDFAPHVVNFLVARRGEEIVGAVGAQRAGADALLRSLVVAPAERGQGLGDRLVRELDRAAGAWGVQRWWLLTTTAEAFFRARGFAVATRCSAPTGIQATGQFAGGCGSAAVCLTRAVGPAATPAAAGRATNADFDATVAELTARLRGFIRQRVRDAATADDLTQETLLKVYRSRASLRDGQRLEAWLYRIARTTIIDHYRRQRPSEELPEVTAAETRDEVATMRAAVLTSTRIFLEELPAAYREPVRLAELEGLPLAKIALRLDLSLTAVKSRVQRGRAMLKKKLQDCCRFEFDRMGKIIGYERRNGCGCEHAPQR
jgi:RNA polymerase sigma factor (SigZ family)